MPLVWELTAELRRWLSPEKLKSFNAGWKLQGEGWSDSSVSLLLSLLQNRAMHYEQVVGAIEVHFTRERDVHRRQELHAVHGFLLQGIRGLLLERQIKNLPFALNVLEDFVGIQKLAEENKPLWVFTSNHDLIVEILAAKFSVPIKTGFDEKISLRIDGGDNKPVDVAFERVSRATIKAHGYDFFKQGDRGINLVKVHGSIDIFGQGDDLNYVKVASEDGTPQSYVRQVQALEAVDMALGQRHRVRATNEHTYLDAQGEIQFLRNSLLSGAHKFSPQMSQVAPPEFLSLFKDYLNYSTELVCIGYGFGDTHINKPIVDWLSLAEQRHLTVVNPGIASCPEGFDHLREQVSLVPQSAKDYFLALSGPSNPLRYAIRGLQTRNRQRRMNELLAVADEKKK
jgi:hypothetical protein